MKRKWKELPFAFKLVLAIVLIAAALFIAMCNYDTQFTDYGRNAAYLSNFGYARAFKVNRLSYEAISKKYEDPVKEETRVIPESADRHIVLMQYPSFEMICVEFEKTDGTTGRSLALLIVQSDTIYFGKQAIHVGSTREEVNRAYAQEPKISADELAYSAEDYPEVDEGFYGEDWSRILFCYDGEDTVESMAYEPPAF